MAIKNIFYRYFRESPFNIIYIVRSEHLALANIKIIKVPHNAQVP